VLLGLPFAKASGAGNDFVIVDNRAGAIRVDQARLASTLCARHTGIGADGLLVLERSLRADFEMKYYNSDGSSGGFCGNGGRCIARYAQLSGITGSHCRFEALGHLYEANIVADGVQLRMKDVSRRLLSYDLERVGRSFRLRFLDTGAPHAVTVADDLRALDIVSLGRSIRHDPAFAPLGTNVSFFRLQEPGRIEMRTYERGVEAETLACGTGAVACAVTVAEERGWKFPINVLTRSGSTLRVHGEFGDDFIKNIILEGEADILFFGKVFYRETLDKLEGYSSLEKPAQ
jgi:diaminopimelate epimerase